MHHELALPELTHDLDGFLEHLLADGGGWPAVAEDVLVQVLARPDAEEEATTHHQRSGSCGLGHDRRVDPDRRARHARAERHLVRDLCNPADHAPHEWAVPL